MRSLALTDDEIQGLGEGGVVLRDQVIPDVEIAACAAEMDALEAHGALRPAGMGQARVHDPTLRGDRITWAADVDRPALRALRVRFDGLREELNAAVWLGLVSFTVQLAVYPGDGAIYARHRDALAGDPARRATAILYLNPTWSPADGGFLRVHLPAGPRDIAPVGGRLVLFLSDRVEHEVLPCHAVRRAATAWFRGP